MFFQALGSINLSLNSFVDFPKPEEKKSHDIQMNTLNEKAASNKEETLESLIKNQTPMHGIITLTTCSGHDGNAQRDFSPLVSKE